MKEIACSDGICTGRNGTVDISGIRVASFGGTVRLDCISKSKKTLLNAGFSMDRDAARKVAHEILDILDESYTKQKDGSLRKNAI